MNVTKFIDQADSIRVGIVESNQLLPLQLGDAFSTLADVLATENPIAAIRGMATEAPVTISDSIRWLPPIDNQEVWAAGVTYKRSQTARMEESEAAASCYDRVYQADRPELFFKATPHRVSGHWQPLRIRSDATWNVPEPEITLVLSPQLRIVGLTVGNDMSSRDIEGENLLYLPQAKMYDRSCSLGPWIVFGPDETEARQWSIGVKITRDGNVVFEGETSINQIKRSFDELSDYLNRSQSFPSGSVLLTGTGVVPDDDFTLEEGDHVAIRVSGIGELGNPVTTV